jgi:hypothetical protein
VNKQPEALWLADWLDADACDLQTPRLAAAELRRLYSVNAELLEALKWAIAASYDGPMPDYARDKARAAIKKAYD